MKSAIKEKLRGHEAVNTDGLLKEELYLRDYLQDPALGLHSTLQDAEQGQKKQHSKRRLQGPCPHCIEVHPLPCKASCLTWKKVMVGLVDTEMLKALFGCAPPLLSSHRAVEMAMGRQH